MTVETRVLSAALLLFAMGIGSTLVAEKTALAQSSQGRYFSKKEYVPQPLPKFSETRGQLPAPIYDEEPLYVQMYWKTWELGFHNFYAKQHEDGEIFREIERATGLDFVQWGNRDQQGLFSRWGRFSVQYVGRSAPQPPPHLTLDALNHPICAWAELESVRVTGDRGRLKLVYEPLLRYYRTLQKYIRQGNGLYMTDWASMDNSPRNSYLVNGGTAVDISSEMALFANQLAEIADLLGKKDDALALRRDAKDLKRLINENMWDPQRKFYFDLTVDGKQASVRTIAAYWTLLAEVASPEQADALAVELRNPRGFGRRHRVPSVPADQAGYDPLGGYWRGDVWPSTNTMVIRGLEKYGKNALAREIALEHLQRVGEVFRTTGTVWECYAPDSAEPGRHRAGAVERLAAKDMVGWTGIVPILYFIEYGIGLKADAPNNRLTWELVSDKRCGCERLPLGRRAGKVGNALSRGPSVLPPVQRFGKTGQPAARFSSLISGHADSFALASYFNSIK